MDNMVEQCAAVAAKVLKMPLNEVKMYARSNETDSCVFFWNPASKGGTVGTVIVSVNDLTFLSANSNVSYAALLNAYKQGYRS